MKKKRNFVLLLFIAFFSVVGYSQEEKETNKVKKEVDKVSKTSEEINETTEATNKAIQGTVENTKQTIQTIGSLFGSGKNKDKNKADVSLIIKEVAYDDNILNSLFSKLSDTKGVKKASKSFSKGTATINIDSKETADAIWLQVPKEIRSSFQLEEISETTVSLTLIQDEE